MAEKKPQSYQNHAKIVPPYHYGITALLLVILLWSLWGLVHPLISAGAVFTFERVIWVLLSLALIGTYLYARLFPLAAQDRIIRLEMRLRLKEVLPDLAATWRG